LTKDKFGIKRCFGRSNYRFGRIHEWRT